MFGQVIGQVSRQNSMIGKFSYTVRETS